MSGYQDYLDALEVLGSAAERAARARDQAGDHGRDDLRHAAMDRREHEQEWDRILTEATHLSRSAQTLARSHGLPVAEAAEAPGVPADPPRDLAGCGRAVRSLRADLDAAQARPEERRSIPPRWHRHRWRRPPLPRPRPHRSRPHRYRSRRSRPRRPPSRPRHRPPRH